MDPNSFQQQQQQQQVQQQQQQQVQQQQQQQQQVQQQQVQVQVQQVQHQQIQQLQQQQVQQLQQQQQQLQQMQLLLKPTNLVSTANLNIASLLTTSTNNNNFQPQQIQLQPISSVVTAGTTNGVVNLPAPPTLVHTTASGATGATPTKSFVCNICNRSFAKGDDLKRHKRTHTGEKPFACNICGRCFGKSNDLKRHGTTHTGEKPFMCIFCGKKFSRSADMKKHARRAHANEMALDSVSSSTDVISQVKVEPAVNLKPASSKKRSSKNYQSPNNASQVKLEPIECTSQNLLNSVAAANLQNLGIPQAQQVKNTSNNLPGFQTVTSNFLSGTTNTLLTSIDAGSMYNSPGIVVANYQLQGITPSYIAATTGKQGETRIYEPSNHTLQGQPTSGRTSFETIDSSSLDRPAASTTTFQTIDVSSLRRPSDILTIYRPAPGVNQNAGAGGDSNNITGSINLSQNPGISNLFNQVASGQSAGGQPAQIINTTPIQHTISTGGMGVVNANLRPGDHIPSYLSLVVKTENHPGGPQQQF